MRRFFVFALAAALLATVVVDSARAAPGRGDSMVVSTQSAPLMRGSSTLATLPRGHRFEIIRTEGKWVGTQTTVNGKTVSGWLWQGQVATPQEFAARPQSVRRYSAMPGAATPYRGPYPYRGYYTGGARSNSPLVMGATRYGPNYWRADRKIMGY